MAHNVVATVEKSPGEVLLRGLDWASFLSGIDGTVTIVGSSWSVTTEGLTVSSVGYSTTYTQCKISGGTSGWTYNVVNHVILSDTQEIEHAIKVVVE